MRRTSSSPPSPPRLRRHARCAVALSLTMSAAAAAQPAPIGPPAAPPPPDGAAPATPAPAAPAPAAPAPAAPAPAAPTGRPSGLAIGIGVGYRFPSSLETPNTTSARIRFAGGLTLEPRVVLTTTSIDLDTENTDQRTEIALGAVVRYPLRTRDKVDLELLGDAIVTNTGIDHPGDDNTQTISALAVGYGVGLSYWLSSHWCVSVSATNSLVTVVRTRSETGPGASEITYSSRVGLVFEPQVTALIHLYL